MTKQCQKCHKNNQPEAKFCQYCNQPFSELAAQPRMCPSGRHPMDPAWTSCPYCSGPQPANADELTARFEQGASRSMRGGTVKEDVNPPRIVPKPPPAPPAPPIAPVKIGKTEFYSASMADSSAVFAGRRIVAVLVTYSLKTSGQMFPIYEGRNYLGRNADCEISLPEDTQMSGCHAAIFYRGGEFEITDEKSMNGTSVNGQNVPLSGGLFLTNYASLKTGATEWKFIIIEPDPGRTTGGASHV